MKLRIFTFSPIFSQSIIRIPILGVRKFLQFWLSLPWSSIEKHVLILPVSVVDKGILTDIKHFNYMFNVAKPKHKNPCPRDHEIHNLGWLFIAHHYDLLSLSDHCPGVEKKNFKDTIIFTMWLIWPHPGKTTPVLEVMKFTILVDPSLIIIIIYLICPIEEKKNF